mgnify:FL=1
MSKDMEEHFTSIYNPNPLSGTMGEFHYSSTNGETVCGIGSMKSMNVEFLDYLKDIVEEYDVKSIIDIGCGDLNYIKSFLDDNPHLEYMGVDISKPLIEENKRKFPHLNFEHHNICESLPHQEFDLCLIKEVFIHLSPSMVSKSLNNIKQGNNVKYLLITGHTNRLPPKINEIGREYGNFTYHFSHFDEQYLSQMTDCKVRLSRLYSIDSIIE